MLSVLQTPPSDSWFLLQNAHIYTTPSLPSTCPPTFYILFSNKLITIEIHFWSPHKLFCTLKGNPILLPVEGSLTTLNRGPRFFINLKLGNLKETNLVSSVNPLPFLYSVNILWV